MISFYNLSKQSIVSNIRAKSIEGHITDSAGNVLRNASIVIKLATPVTGSIVVDTIISDEDGYFKSTPLQNGVYDIYESGINISKLIHIACPGSIPCFKPNIYNYIQTLIKNFTLLASEQKLYEFKYFIQIEPEETDVETLGNTYPIYNHDIVDEVTEDLYSLSKFFQFTSESRITTTRFDIEYFSPITASSKLYKRIRWAGVPGIRFFNDSKIVVPIDYLSIVPSLPKYFFNYEDEIINIDYEGLGLILEPSGEITQFSVDVQNIFIGDIIKVINDDIDNTYVYCIVDDVFKGESEQSVILEKLKSSRFTSTYTPEMNEVRIKSIEVFDGIFQGITEINDGVNEKFCVVENTYAQNNNTELYNYNAVPLI